jgi:hypothetical protein
MIRSEPVAPARVAYVGGPLDGREAMVEVPGGIPTIFPVDAPLGYYIRDKSLSDGRWRMAWRAFEVGAEDADSTTILGNGR